MNRRAALRTLLATASAVPAVHTFGALSAAQRPFKMKFAPHFGMFKNSATGGELDELKFASDQGFTAWEDNLMRDRPVAVQEAIRRTLDNRGISMGTVSALRGFKEPISFTGDDEAIRAEVLKMVQESVEVALRVGAPVMTVVPGNFHAKLAIGYQTANCIDLLRRCCDIVEPSGLVMVLEPLNHRSNHPGKFLHRSDQTYAICKAVNRKSCKILFDIYHQQITEGNLIPNIDLCWDEIAYFQSADNPGRKEPGTGEIHYANVLQHLNDKGWTGIVGMEHGNSMKGLEGEQAVIDAYRKVDPK